MGTMTGSRIANGLEALEAEVARDLARLNYPPAGWVPERRGPDGQPMIDVLIIGAGMNGLGAAFALRRLGISHIRQIDARPPGLEGPWLTYARMTFLRSPKHLTGPAQGLSALTFRAWWEAQHDADAWESLGFIVREEWARYLAWFARVTGARIDSATRLSGLTPHDHSVTAHLVGQEGVEDVHARQVVLATGREGQARPRIPEPFRPHLGAGVQHSADPLDVAALKGRRVVVVGLSASAFDNACLAGEAGADVTLLGRAPQIPTVNKMKQTVYPGFAHGFPDLPDTERIGWLRAVAAARTAPPRHTVQRAARAGVRIVLGVETETVERLAGGLRLTTTRGVFGADLVILGTGFRFDLRAAPELSDIAPRILRWSDVVGEGGVGITQISK